MTAQILEPEERAEVSDREGSLEISERVPAVASFQDTDGSDDSGPRILPRDQQAWGIIGLGDDMAGDETSQPGHRAVSSG
jgi:hypothetical protein